MNDLINMLLRGINRYHKIKNNPEKREVSVSFGVHSIVFSVIAVLCASLGLIMGSDFGVTNGLGAFFVLIFSVAIAYIGPILFLFYSFLYMIWQFSINKRAIGWFALAVFILGVAGSAFFMIGSLSI